MSQDKNFLSRWSRKKRETVELPPQAAAPAARDAEPKESAPAAPVRDAKAVKPEADEPKFDLASLPSIDSIGPDTDIRAFLLPGVPAELTRAALRRVWMADPAIRDFIGLAENSWDFTKQGGVPGFDLSDPGIDVKRLAAELFGAESKAAEEKSSEATPLSTESAQKAPEDAPVAAGRSGEAAGSRHIEIATGCCC